jgi:hypothetical protein
MWMTGLGEWTVMGMAQIYPVVTLGAPGRSESPLNRSAFYPTQSAAMINFESPDSRFSFRVTPNFEGLTLPEGETTFGGWGEGYIDKRHPHTLIHEAMFSFNLWDGAGGGLSLSAGKGFAPYGTDDPMARPVLKYPTNHHLSQILERWTMNLVYLRGGSSIEAGLFGGTEPEGPYDFSNITPFGDSFSFRLTQRFGRGIGPMAEWEVSGSYARVRETHDGRSEVTNLVNTAVRHASQNRFGTVYALAEASRGEPEHQGSYFSILAEAAVAARAHRPYYRVEHATRPEYPREAADGDRFFRYDHEDHAIGATRWLINSFGYEYDLGGYPFISRPFVEVQHHRVRPERGGIRPDDLFGTSNFWSVSFGVRLFLGGSPMRMGAYGVLDPMTVAHRSAEPRPEAPHHHAPRH